MPILKQLVSGSSHKRRSRMDLTREMISAPLGDFRHTMHVGRSGDAFGDTSFLSTRSGEPPREEAAAAAAAAYPHSPRPGLLSRTFRSSKRSLSVTRVDQQAPLPGDSPTYVKNAMSLPFLNDDDCLVDDMVPKSLSSSPLKQEGEPGVRPSNGAAGAAQRLELHERGFGELTELPEAAYHYGGGMKHAESVMSFHIDLGPSMLGDILGVMQQKEEDDQGYDEEWKGSEGSASPSLSARGDAAEEEEEEEEKEQEDGAEVGREEEEEEEEQDVMQEEVERQEVELPGSVDMEPETGGPDTPETRPRHLQQHLDSCSVSSAGSAALEERAGSQPYADTDSATFSAPPPEEESNNISSFMMEDEDDEIPL